MLPFWMIFGAVFVLLGIFNRQVLGLLGLKPMSEVFTNPSLKHSSQITEGLGRWLVIVLGLSFFVYGLGNDLSYKISLLLSGLAGLMILGMIGITLARWKAR